MDKIFYFFFFSSLLFTSNWLGIEKNKKIFSKIFPRCTAYYGWVSLPAIVHIQALKLGPQTCVDVNPWPIQRKGCENKRSLLGKDQRILFLPLEMNSTPLWILFSHLPEQSIDYCLINFNRIWNFWKFKRLLFSINKVFR